MKHMTVRQALQHVADNPVPLETDQTQIPVYESISRVLWTIANSGNSEVRGSMARANKAKRMIMNRLVGKRRTGTMPARKQQTTIEFVDLTGKALDE